MRKVLRLLTLLCLIIMCFCLSACGNETGKTYKIYYGNESGDGFSTKEYTSETTEPQKLAEEMIAQMNERQKSDQYQVLKLSDVTIKSVNVENEIARVEFGQDYVKMDNVHEFMYRAGLVKTLTQADGISYVTVYVGGQSLAFDNGRVVGMMSADDFVDDTNGNLNELKHMDLTLYFGNNKGDKLVKETRNVAYSKTSSIEKIVVEQLIYGPNQGDNVRTLPSDLKIISVNVKNSICYINFNAAFTKTIMNISANVTVYSIVNSLCELNGIQSVQIMVEGESKMKFRESIDFENPLKSNMELVVKEQ